jgi:hypothetical protein
MGPFLLLYEDCGEEVRHVDAAQPERGEIDADHPIGLGQSHIDGAVFAKGTAGGDQHTVAAGRWDKRRCVLVAKRVQSCAQRQTFFDDEVGRIYRVVVDRRPMPRRVAPSVASVFGETSLGRSFPMTDFRIPAVNSDRKARAVFIET